MTTQTPSIEACREIVNRGSGLPPFLAKWLVDEYERLSYVDERPLGAYYPEDRATILEDEAAPSTHEEPMQRRPVVNVIEIVVSKAFVDDTWYVMGELGCPSVLR